MKSHLCIYSISSYTCECIFLQQHFSNPLDKYGLKTPRLCLQHKNFRMKKGNWYIHLNNLRGQKIKGLKEKGHTHDLSWYGLYYGSSRYYDQIFQP